ncbi:MAG TPA: ATP phosphoribosyltransferase regulatory subunit, partial [Candidatus Methanomethylicus sp.]|nr:ATP phosphoribosyltransferase regulatory subunit [Candidatus Methanomethylicus sp.]
MKFGRPRGTRDFLPDEMGVRRVILDKVRNAFEMHGFEEMDTPAIELWEVLAAKGGDEVERQIYRFQDKGERWLGLRFDLTVPLARVVANTPDLTKPFKRFNISKVWRYEEPQSGRFREFVQADIDIVGAARMEADLECVSTAVDALRALGLGDFEVRINDRKILDGMVEGLGMGAEGKAKVFRSLDRLDKVGEGGVARELAAMGLPEGKAGAVLEFTHFRGQEAIDYVARELASLPYLSEDSVPDVDTLRFGFFAEHRRRLYPGLRLRAGAPILCVAKGIERDTLLRGTEVIAQVLRAADVAILVGPS